MNDSLSLTPCALAWSGGKDSALMLHALLQAKKYHPAILLTTVDEATGRIGMHDVRGDLLAAQAHAVGIELMTVPIPWPCPNGLYAERMAAACNGLKARGITTIAYGDLFLEDIRAYREERMAEAGMQAIYPLWDKDTTALARQFTEEGFRARLCCVDTRRLPASFAGREYDANLLADLPEGCDPCGENGEFHSFTYAGPIFAAPLACQPGQVVLRDGFAYCDVIGNL